MVYDEEIEVTTPNMENEEDDNNSKTRVWDISNQEDKKALEKELNSNGMFFKAVTGKQYKVSLTSTKIEERVSEWEGKTRIQYNINIKATNKDEGEFIGIWTVSKTVLDLIIKGYVDYRTIYLVQKNGSGENTRYSVIPLED